MEAKDLEKVVHDKNSIISLQLRRIQILENKIAELNHKYILLKYKDQEPTLLHNIKSVLKY